MNTNCKYDAKKDISPLVPDLDVNLTEAIATGSVPGAGVPVEFNGIEETSQILGRPSDVFDAIEHQKYLASKADSLRSKKDSASAQVPASVPPAAPVGDSVPE